MNHVRREPVAIVALVEALIVLAVAFGLSITAEQMAAVMAVVVIGGGIVARSHVSPTTD